MAQTKLTARQRRFITELLAGKGITAATEAAGIKSRSTAYRYLAQEDVQAELRECGGAVLVASQARLGALLDAALVIVAAGLAGQQLGGDRRWAAGAVLRHCVRLLELLNLEARVTRLENRT